MVALLSTLAGSVFLMAPSAYHRIRFRDRDKEAMLRISNVFAIVGMVFLAIGMTAVVFLVTDMIFKGDDDDRHGRDGGVVRDRLVRAAVGAEGDLVGVSHGGSTPAGRRRCSARDDADQPTSADAARARRRGRALRRPRRSPAPAPRAGARPPPCRPARPPPRRRAAAGRAPTSPAATTLAPAPSTNDGAKPVASRGSPASSAAVTAAPSRLDGVDPGARADGGECGRDPGEEPPPPHGTSTASASGSSSASSSPIVPLPAITRSSWTGWTKRPSAPS